MVTKRPLDATPVTVLNQCKKQCFDNENDDIGTFEEPLNFDEHEPLDDSWLQKQQCCFFY